jgi:hypothetical protein
MSANDVSRLMYAAVNGSLRPIHRLSDKLRIMAEVAVIKHVANNFVIPMLREQLRFPLHARSPQAHVVAVDEKNNTITLDMSEFNNLFEQRRE